jgi:hypothetical protein
MQIKNPTGIDLGPNLFNSICRRKSSTGYFIAPQWFFPSDYNYAVGDYEPDKAGYDSLALTLHPGTGGQVPLRCTCGLLEIVS